MPAIILIGEKYLLGDKGKMNAWMDQGELRLPHYACSLEKELCQ